MSDCLDVEKLLHTYLFPMLAPASGNMLVSGDYDSHKRDPMLAINMEITCNNYRYAVYASVCITSMFTEPADYITTLHYYTVDPRLSTTFVLLDFQQRSDN